MMKMHRGALMGLGAAILLAALNFVALAVLAPVKREIDSRPEDQPASRAKHGPDD